MSVKTGIIETEESLIIETPERVPIEFALASIGNRFLAVLIDHTIQFLTIGMIVYFVSWLIAPEIGDEPSIGVEDLRGWTLAVFIFIITALFSGYFVVFEWLWNGQTPGKRLLRLRVIRDDGRPIVFWEALIRNIIRLIDAFPGGVIPIYSVGLIVIFLNKSDQRVGDLFAGTVVIREPQDKAPTFDETFTEEISDSAFRRVNPVTRFDSDISGLTEDEMEIVETYLRRRWDLVERQRQWMAWRIALPIMFKLKPGYDPKTFTYEGFLEELFHRYNAGIKRF